ncbi:ABC-2 type transport system permease protein [Ruminiclostridium sufflavum DSM 19573]|uniref:ABC-2 type transport system permease protein n=1 Tax=Ruminiclostridium sufflavum DSM 19573 TaxID=1121337 RepID=A0A318XKD4_9FIRM|nr:ABC transporter permease [Ruminiclostridium sufflavum]PYG87821.1 ABC-2 type transport system permease protein [Ruminiclostridium sufflavum DSM 19573]
MREFLEVFKYTFKENLKKKTFIISTIAILVLITGVMLVPAIVTKVQSQAGNDNGPADTGEKRIVYLVDNSGYFEKGLQDIQKQFPGYQIKLEAKDKIESLKADIKENGKSFLIVAKLEKDIPEFEYYTKQYDDGPGQSEIAKVFKQVYSAELLKQSDVPQATISKVMGDLQVNVNELGKNKWGGYFASIFIVMLLFFAVYFCGYGVAMSVASEKTSRVMELLVTSVKPSRIILGKTAGMGALELVQLLLVMLVGIVTYMLAFPADFTLGGMSLDLSAFTPFALAMILIYFILGYSLYALLFAVVGATVSKAEDVSSAMMPMSFVSIISFYFAYGTFAVPDSTAARAASLIPFTSPFSVPSRLISTAVPAWEIAASLGILAITIVFTGMLSIKLYSFAVLHYGDRLKLGALFKSSRSGN